MQALRSIDRKVHQVSGLVWSGQEGASSFGLGLIAVLPPQLSPFGCTMIGNPGVSCCTMMGSVHDELSASLDDERTGGPAALARTLTARPSAAMWLLCCCLGSLPWHSTARAVLSRSGSHLSVVARCGGQTHVHMLEHPCDMAASLAGGLTFCPGAWCSGAVLGML